MNLIARFALFIICVLIAIGEFLGGIYILSRSEEVLGITTKAMQAHSFYGFIVEGPSILLLVVVLPVASFLGLAFLFGLTENK